MCTEMGDVSKRPGMPQHSSDIRCQRRASLTKREGKELSEKEGLMPALDCEFL